MSITFASSSNPVTGSQGQITLWPVRTAVISDSDSYNFATASADLVKGGFKQQLFSTSVTGDYSGSTAVKTYEGFFIKNARFYSN